MRFSGKTGDSHELQCNSGELRKKIFPEPLSKNFIYTNMLMKIQNQSKNSPRPVQTREQKKSGRTKKHCFAVLSDGSARRMYIGLLGTHFETLLELVYTTASVNKLLLTGEERMALGADVHAKLTVCITLRGASGYSFTASATNGYFFILRMDSVFHCFHLYIQILT